MNVVLFTTFLVVAYVTAECPTPKYLGKFPVTQAAFLDILSNNYGSSDLFITTFGGAPFSKGTVKRVADIGSVMSTTSINAIRPSIVNPKVTWPNGVKSIPSSVTIAGTSNTQQRVISCGGFLVPSHGDGSCIVYDINGEEIKTITLAKAGRGSFFHHAEFYDVDNDGLEDMIVAKATKGLFGAGKGGLYWYKNPGTSNTRSKRWREYKLFNGPDVIFKLKDLDKDGIPEIIATQFFTEKLTVNWIKPGGTFMNGPWEQRVVLDNLGGLFGMTMTDVNNNGKEEIVLTNHVTDPEVAGVYAITLPSDFKTGKYTVKTLANGFETLNSGPGQASPGGAVPFYMKSFGDIPLFAVSGDGNQKAYIVCKVNNEWIKEDFLDTGNTVGAIAVSDVNGNGTPEVFVPSYEKGEIHVFTYDS